MRVSVITPTWGRRDWLLRRCVPSVHELDYPDVEHVVVIDGPDPGLAAELEAMGVTVDQLPTHNPVRHWGAAARRRGLELATGDLIAYLDDDDAYRPQHATVLARALQAVPDAGFAYSLMAVDGAVVGSDPPEFCHIGTPMIMHRAGILQQETWGADAADEDWDLVWRWLQAGIRYVHVPDITVDVWPSRRRDDAEFDPAEELARVFGPR